MAALHDGQRFLIEEYAVATTPGLSLTDPASVRITGTSLRGPERLIASC